MTQETSDWKTTLANLRNEMLTVAFLQEDEERPWEEFGGFCPDRSEDEAVLRWAESFGDRLHGLFAPLNALEAELREANETAAIEGMRASHIEEEAEAALTAERTARAQAVALLRETRPRLDQWKELATKGLRRSGVGQGAVTIGKWDADEEFFWTGEALGKIDAYLATQDAGAGGES